MKRLLKYFLAALVVITGKQQVLRKGNQIKRP